ncbi:MAG: glycosyl hydrolase family 28 protein, partial [Planctomycetota bacterium]
MKKIVTLVTFLITTITVGTAFAQCIVGPHDSVTGDDTNQIEAAFANCKAPNVITMTPGETYYTGTLILQSNIIWDISNVTIQTIDDETKFHPVTGFSEKIWIGGPRGVSNITIKGVQGDSLASALKRKTSLFPLDTIYLTTVDDFTVQDILLDSRESPGGKGHGGFHIKAWLSSRDITIQRVAIKGNKAWKTVGTDGIHIDNTRNVTINNCDIDVYDDNIAFRADFATEFDVDSVTVSNTTVHGRIRFGRGMNADIKNITFNNVTIDQSSHVEKKEAFGFCIGGTKGCYDTAVAGREEIGDVKDIAIQNVDIVSPKRIIGIYGYRPGVWIGRAYDIKIDTLTVTGSVSHSSKLFGIDRLSVHHVTSVATTFDISDVCGGSIYNNSGINFTYADTSNLVFTDTAPVCSSDKKDFLEVDSPNGGELWSKNSTHIIRWSSVGAVASVRLEFSANNGISWTGIVASTPNDGEYLWTIPNVLSNNCLVRISDAEDGDLSDTSNAAFAIVDEIVSLIVDNVDAGFRE